MQFRLTEYSLRATQIPNLKLLFPLNNHYSDAQKRLLQMCWLGGEQQHRQKTLTECPNYHPSGATPHYNREIRIVKHFFLSFTPTVLGRTVAYNVPIVPHFVNCFAANITT